MKYYTLLSLAILCTSCSSIKSDLSFHKGKQCFWNGEYDEALTHLNSAIELNPTSSPSHRQLALTYERLKNLPLAWEHVRIAYSIDKKAQINLDVFSRIFRALAKQHRFDAPRKPDAGTIVEALGVADKYLHNDQGELKALYYGPICLHIEHGKLSSTEWLSQTP